MASMLKGVLFDAKNKVIRVVDFEDDLDNFYDLIDCRCITCASRKVGDKYYDIICDDEGSLISKPLISAVNRNGKVMLVGNLIILNSAKRGKWQSINEDDFYNIQDNIGMIETHDRISPVLFVEY